MSEKKQPPNTIDVAEDLLDLFEDDDDHEFNFITGEDGKLVRAPRKGETLKPGG